MKKGPNSEIKDEETKINIEKEHFETNSSPKDDETEGGEEGAEEQLISARPNFYGGDKSNR